MIQTNNNSNYSDNTGERKFEVTKNKMLIKFKKQNGISFLKC